MAIDRNAIGAYALETLTIDGVDVGGTNSEYSFEFTQDLLDITVEQSMFPIKKKLTNRTAQSTVSLAEGKLATVAIALDLPANNISSSTLTVNSSERGEVTFVATIEADAGNVPGIRRSFNMPQTRMAGSTRLTYGKESAFAMETTWDHLADNNGSIGTIIDHA